MCSPIQSETLQISSATTTTMIRAPATPEIRVTLPRKKPVAVVANTSPRGAVNIRARYLNRLGITKDPKPQQKIGRIVRRHDGRTLSESLKKDFGESDDTASTRARSFPESPIRKKKTTVSFDNTVAVRQIPMSCEYSSRVKTDLWWDRDEMRRMTSRNSLEFQSENWDWKQVREDLVRTSNGDYVHPIHFIRRCNMQRQFFQVMYAMQSAS